MMDHKSGTFTFDKSVTLSKEDARYMARHERLHLLHGKVTGEKLLRMHQQISEFERHHGVEPETWEAFVAWATDPRPRRGPA